MYKTKLLVFGALMACISALFQIIPVFLSEALVILTIFSAIPIYIISRMNPKIGIVTGIISFVIIGFFSMHEALFFVFTNGTVGVSLGCLTHYTNRRAIFLPSAAIILSGTLSILNFAIGIPIFGAPIPGNEMVQGIIMFTFAFFYCLIYSFLCELVFKKLKIFATWYK